MNAKNDNAGLSHIGIIIPDREPITLPRRMRNFYSPLHLAGDHAQVTVSVTPADSRATVKLNGYGQADDDACWLLSLDTGLNQFSGCVTAADGVTQNQFTFKIIREHAQPGWRMMLREAPWRPRDSAGELVFQDRMWILGGFTPELDKDVWSSSDGQNWTHESDVPTEAGIDIPIAFVLNGHMYVVDFEGVLFRSSDGRTWEVVSLDLPWKNRRRAGAAVFAGKVWIMGGMTADGQLLNDVWSSSDGEHWTRELEHAPWCSRQIDHTPQVFANKLWLLGGGAMGSQYHPFVAWNDVWCSSDGKDWQCVSEAAPWSPRIWGSTAVYRDRLWLIGGFRSEPVWENLGDVWYTRDGDHWRRLNPSLEVWHSNMPADTAMSKRCWQPRHEQSVYVHDDALWLAGGMIWPLMNDVWKLHLPGLVFLTQPVLETYTKGLYVYQAHADFQHSTEPVRYRLIESPSWLQVDPHSGRVTGEAPEPGKYTVTLAAVTRTESTRQQFDLHVLPISERP